MGLLSLTYVKVITVTFSNLNGISYHTKERQKLMIFNTSFLKHNNPPS